MPLLRQGLPLCLALCIFSACLGHEPEPSATDPSSGDAPEAAEIDWTDLLPEAPPSAPRDVEGAAPEMAEQAPSEAPEADLGSRMQVRALEIPRGRVGATVSFEMPDGDQGWAVRLPGFQALLTPAYGGGRVYVGGGFSSTTVYAIDAESGRIDWHVTASDGGPSAAIYYDDNIYFNTESCTLFAVDGQRGRVLWRRWLGDPLMSMPAAAEGRVFSGHIWPQSPSGYGFTAMDALTGRVLWQRPMPHDVISAPTTHGDSVFFATMDGTLWRLRQRDGRVLWRRPLRATTAPWVDGERLLLARRVRPPAGARGVHEQQIIVNAADGSVRWEGEAVPARHLRGGGRARRIITNQAGAWGADRGAARGHLGVRNVAEGWAYQGPRPAVIDGRAYQVVGDRIECRRLEDGEVLWSRRYAQDGGALAMSPPAIAGSQMVVGTVDGHVYGLDIDTGMAVWAYDVGEPIVYQPSVARGRVYVSTARGRVVAFPVGDRDTLDGWHMWGGDPSHSGLSADPADVDWDDPALVVDGSAAGGEGDEGGPGEGELRIIDPEDHRVESMPLEHTRVSARVSGFVASVTLEQVFRNEQAEEFEAAYHFPLPTGAAVDSMLIRAGERTILGRIERRQEARIIYRRAQEAGLLAALLEQQRPNLFTQRVANVPPGESVTVEIHYVQLLPFDSGEYEFMFPMVAGARAEDPTAAGGEAEAVEQHTPGTRPAERIEVSLDIDAGLSIEDLWSPTHDLDVEQISEREARVTLGEGDDVPNRDLVVRYRVAADMPRAAALSHEDERGGFFTLMVQPGLEVPEELAPRRRLTFAIDTSSSMLGRPLAQAKAIVNEALASLGPEDELQVVSFSDLVRVFGQDGPVAATDEQVIAAERFVDGLRALGTTSMTAGLERTLAQGPAAADVLDSIVLVTDGYVASEASLLRLVHERLGGRRLHTIGVGPAPNRFLLERLAELGRGSTMVVSPGERPEIVSQAFVERIASPQLTDIEIEWGDLTVHSVYPRRVPDLHAGQPLLVSGRYSSPGEDRVVLRGRLGDRAFEQHVPVVLASADADGNQALPAVWARAAVHDLMNGLYLREDPDREEAITALGLAFGLVTRFTSFVAVEDRFVSGAGGAGGALHALGALMGDQIGDGFGYGGLGLAGSGHGGGGAGEGTIGLGTMNTIGHGGGGGSGAGYGLGRALAARAATSLPAVRAGAAQVRGSLPREAIRRTIRLHLNEIRAAYESQLRRDPRLEGRVVVRVVIGPDGRVTAASIASSTLGSPEVEARLLNVFRRIRFSPVEGGGVYVVNYPILFTPAPD